MKTAKQVMLDTLDYLSDNRTRSLSHFADCEIPVLHDLKARGFVSFYDLGNGPVVAIVAAGREYLRADNEAFLANRVR